MPYLAVAIGGFCGAIVRFAISEWMGTYRGFPIATWLINLAGSFILAWFYTITVERMRIHPAIRLGIGTGFIGAFTTFSTFTVDTWKLMDARMFAMAFTYVIVSFAGGLLAAWAGYILAIRQSRLRLTRGVDEQM